MGQAWLGLKNGAEGFMRPVVIKIIQQGKFREHLVREAQILARLQHPNLVQVIGLEEINGQLHLILEWVHGLTLKEFLKINTNGDGIYTAKKIFFGNCFILDQILRALEYCHARNPAVIHGDVTPQNILISRQGQVKLADFGIALWSPAVLPDKTCASSQDQVLWGNPKYVAPEVRNGQRPTPLSDLYQSGRILKQILSFFPQDDLSNPLGKIMEQATAQNPQDRICDVKSFRQDMALVLRQERPDWFSLGQKSVAEILTDQISCTQEIFPDASLSQTLPVYAQLPRVASQNLSQGYAFAVKIFSAIMFGILLVSWPQSLMKELNIPRAKENPNLEFMNSHRQEIKSQKAVPLAHGTLEIQARPWAIVFLNTVKIGATPKVLQLKPGEYEVEFVHPLYAKKKKKRLLLKAGARKTALVDME